MPRTLGYWWRVVAVATVLSGAIRPVLAADTSPITLRFGDDVPKTHPISVYGSAFWMEMVKRLTNDRVASSGIQPGSSAKGGTSWR